MQQHALPAVVQLLLRVLAAQNVCNGGQPLDLRQLVLHMAVGLLIICLRGIGSSVILQIQLSVPGMHVTVCVVHILVHLAEEFSGSSRLYIGQSRQLVHSPAQLQHLSGNTAAAVSVSVGDQGIFAEILVLEFFPASDYGVGSHHTVVGGIPGRGVLSLAGCIYKVGEDFASVDSSPFEQIIGNGVELVPADLRGHESVNLTQLQNLRQRPAVAEYIRKPQVLAFLSELALKEPGTVKELAYQRLAGGNVAVGLYPHTAVGLPLALGNSLLDALIKLGAVFLNIFVKLRLSLQEYILVVLLHQTQNRGERSLCFFSGVFQTPQPGHVDMGMAHHMNCHIRMLLQPVQLVHQHLMRLVHRLIEGILIPVNVQKRPVQSRLQGRVILVILRKQHQGLRDGTGKIVKLIGILMQISQICLFQLMIEGPVYAAAFQSRPQKEGKPYLFSLFSLEEHFVMIGIHPLVRMSVHIQQGFKSAVISSSGLAEVKQTHHLAAFFRTGKRYFLFSPQITVSSNKGII